MRNYKLEKQIKAVGNLYMVVHNNEIKQYKSERAAYLAAKQFGGDAIPFTVFVSYSDVTEITVEGMERRRMYRRNYEKKYGK